MEDRNLYKGQQLHSLDNRVGAGGRRRYNFEEEERIPAKKMSSHDYYRDDPFERPLSSLRDEPLRRPLPPPRDPYFDRHDPYLDAFDLPPLPAPIGPMPDRPPFECQLLLLGPQLQDYAEMIERKLQVKSLLCDLAMVSDEAHIKRAVEDTVRRSVPYAIVLRPQNEAHRSVTLNILHGTPQEHRNMPVDDALGLVLRDFDTFVEELQKKQRAPPAVPARPDLPSKSFNPDKNVRYLLNLLADNRILTLEEINTVLAYLKEHRHNLYGPQEPLESAPTHQPSPLPVQQARLPPEPRPVSGAQMKPLESDINHRQQNLQDQIIDMLNGRERNSPPTMRDNPYGLVSYPIPRSLSVPQPVPAPQATSVSTVAGINLDNPTVQNALDNLLQNTPSLLRNITAISAANTGTSNTAPSAVRQPLFPAGVADVRLSASQPQMMGQTAGESRSHPLSGRQGKFPWEL